MASTSVSINHPDLTEKILEPAPLTDPQAIALAALGLSDKAFNLEKCGRSSHLLECKAKHQKPVLHHCSQRFHSICSDILADNTFERKRAEVRQLHQDYGRHLEKMGAKLVYIEVAQPIEWSRDSLEAITEETADTVTSLSFLLPTYIGVPNAFKQDGKAYLRILLPMVPDAPIQTLDDFAEGKTCRWNGTDPDFWRSLWPNAEVKVRTAKPHQSLRFLRSDLLKPMLSGPNANAESEAIFENFHTLRTRNMGMIGRWQREKDGRTNISAIVVAEMSSDEDSSTELEEPKGYKKALGRCHCGEPWERRSESYWNKNKPASEDLHWFFVKPPG